MMERASGGCKWMVTWKNRAVGDAVCVPPAAPCPHTNSIACRQLRAEPLSENSPWVKGGVSPKVLPRPQRQLHPMTGREGVQRFNSAVSEVPASLQSAGEGGSY